MCRQCFSLFRRDAESIQGDVQPGERKETTNFISAYQPPSCCCSFITFVTDAVTGSVDVQWACTGNAFEHPMLEETSSMLHSCEQMISPNV